MYSGRIEPTLEAWSTNKNVSTVNNVTVYALKQTQERWASRQVIGRANDKKSHHISAVNRTCHTHNSPEVSPT